MVLAAKAAEMPLIDFAFKTTLPISIAAIIAMAIAHFFWQRFLDKENISHEMLDVAEIHDCSVILRHSAVYPDCWRPDF